MFVTKGFVGRSNCIFWLINVYIIQVSAVFVPSKKVFREGIFIPINMKNDWIF